MGRAESQKEALSRLSTPPASHKRSLPQPDSLCKQPEDSHYIAPFIPSQRWISWQARDVWLLSSSAPAWQLLLLSVLIGHPAEAVQVSRKLPANFRQHVKTSQPSKRQAAEE